MKASEVKLKITDKDGHEYGVLDLQTLIKGLVDPQNQGSNHLFFVKILFEMSGDNIDFELVNDEQ